MRRRASLFKEVEKTLKKIEKSRKVAFLTNSEKKILNAV